MSASFPEGLDMYRLASAPAQKGGERLTQGEEMGQIRLKNLAPSRPMEEWIPSIIAGGEEPRDVNSRRRPVASGRLLDPPGGEQSHTLYGGGRLQRA